MPDSHPLNRTFAKLNAISAHYKVQIGAPLDERWFTFSEVIESHAYDAIATIIASGEPKASRRYIGMRILSSAVWSMNLIGLASYLVDLRVPDFTQANLRLHWREEGWADITAVSSPCFYALPNDPAAKHPDAIIVPTEDALREIFRRQYEANIAAMIPTLKASSGLGKGAVWACAADHCVSMITYATRHMRQLERCDSEVTALVQVADSPMQGKSGVLWIESEDRREPFLDRGSCCLWYTVTPESKSYCSTCPLRPLDERIEQLRAYMASEPS